MTSPSRICVTLTILMLILAASVKPGRTQTGADGQIVFESMRDGEVEIFTMIADGTGQRRLTNRLTESHGFSGYPAWSPEGRQIAFESSRDGNLEIYVMNVDGRNVKRLTFNSAVDEFPTWSPGGDRIVFDSDRDGDEEIYVMNADGNDPVRLTNNDVPDQFPKWRR